MSSKEILEKAIQKAIDGGWPTILASSMVEWNVYADPINGRPGVAHKLADRLVGVLSFTEVIYDPTFAKALWGEHRRKKGDTDDHWVCTKCGDSYWMYEYEHDADTCWEYHLRQMVIADNSIKYLGENI